MVSERRRSLVWALLAIAALVVAVVVALAFRKRPAGDAGEASELAMSWAGRDLEASESQDVAPDEDFRVNVYQDEGFVSVSRAEIDLDRDGQRDERWTFHIDGRISRRVATSDDERFDRAEVWRDGRWEPPGEDETELDPALDSLIDDVLDGLPPAPE